MHQRERTPKTPEQIEGLFYNTHTKHDKENKRIARATVVARLVGGEIHYGIAICSENDQFERSTGRRIAAERCQKNPQKIPFGTQAEMGEDAEAVMIRVSRELVDKATENPARFKRKICTTCH